MSGSSHDRPASAGARWRAMLSVRIRSSPKSRFLHPGIRSLVALVGLALLSSCRREETAGKSAPQILRISQRNEPADLDPTIANLPDDFFVIRALSEGLLVPA